MTLATKLTRRLRFTLALLARFKVTLVLTAVMLGPIPLLFRQLYSAGSGTPLSFGAALHHVYFLMFGEPSLPYVDSAAVEALNLLIPPFSVVVIIDGIIRFAYLFFAKHRSDKEWIEVMSQVMRGHVIVCGAGRVGYRVAVQLLELKQEVLVIEKREDAAFVGALRDSQVPVLIDDIRSARSLERTNPVHAAAIVCATDDDLANMNIALDARRLNPSIRVVLRLFDEDLVAKVKDTFKAEALSSSSIAAPAMALAALDPRIIHSFQVGGNLMVVSHFVAAEPLTELDVSALRDRFGGLTLSLQRQGAAEQLHPSGAMQLRAGDVLTIQCEYSDYLKLRAFTKETQPPVSLAHRVQTGS